MKLDHAARSIALMEGVKIFRDLLSNNRSGLSFNKIIFLNFKAIVMNFAKSQIVSFVMIHDVRNSK